MRSGNNIHVQQHKTNLINEEWNKTQNDAPFVAFYNMRAVTFVLSDEMANVSIAGLQWFILMPRLNHTFPFQTLFTSRKNLGWCEEKMQVNNIFSCSNSVFKFSVIFIFVVCKCFQFEPA